jgi:hypothetical protein
MEVAIKTLEVPENSGLISDKDKSTLDSIRKEIKTLKFLKH